MWEEQELGNTFLYNSFCRILYLYIIRKSISAGGFYRERDNDCHVKRDSWVNSWTIVLYL